jgi:tRNA U34 5-methylaminomethyl-2-thiouridine-forming methyltransferase MnmC
MEEEITSTDSLKIQVTRDGSHTLFVPELNEHYHSVFGAINESRHIFINAGLNSIAQKSGKIKILEIGFGTGLNALLSCIEAGKNDLYIDYQAIELFPLPEEIYLKLNYPEHIEEENSKETFMQIHSCPWNQHIKLSDHFSLTKLNISLQNYLPEKQYFDLIYFDAFGPDVQPEMWTVEVFKKMAFALRQGGVLVTYSTKGVVKRNMKEAGFSIEKLPGPVGKREILRGRIYQHTVM